jgi:hypothetical protein
MPFALERCRVCDGALAADEKPSQRRSLTHQAQVRMGDFDQMLERRAIRMGVPYSRTLYTNVAQGKERGLTAEL